MADRKIVEIVCVGTEILLGNIVNTNAQFLAKECAALGLSNYYQTVVGDNEDRLKETINLALSRSDIVILSGGLGPTQDDLTKEVAAKIAGKELYLDKKSEDNIKAIFKARGYELTPNNKKQAMVPKDSIILDNSNGTAPGVIIPYNDKYMILLPGPPGELKLMFKESVEPFLRSLSKEVFVTSTVKVVSVGESICETKIMDLIENQTNPTIATYAHDGEVHIRVTANAETEEEANKLIKPVVRELKQRFGNNVYTTHNDVSLEQAVVDLCKGANLRIKTVESCTAGMVAARIVNVPGASEIFKYGLITYSNKAKRKLTGVKKATLEKYTAVSKEIACEMVRNIDIGPKADVLIGVTGYADSNDESIPAGLVYIAVNVCGKTRVEEYRFNGDRNKVRTKATTQALVLVRECMLEYLSEMTFRDA